MYCHLTANTVVTVLCTRDHLIAGYSSHLLSYFRKYRCTVQLIFFVFVVSRYNSTGGNYVVTRDMYRSENNSKWRINGKNATMKEVHFSVYSLQSRVICKGCFMFREVQDLYLQLFTRFCQQVESSTWMLLVYM